MSSNDVIPNSPAGWKHYSESHSLPTLPQRTNLVAKDSKYVLRDIYVDAPAAIATSTSSFTNIYADVLAFPTPNTTITIPQDGVVNLVCRTVTASGPLTLTLDHATTDESVFMIYGSTFDQPISYKLNSSTTPAITLDLSPSSGNLGAQIDIINGEATLTYLDRYVDLSMSDVEFKNCLVTQLRIASILFWIQPSLALALTSHVARATDSSEAGALLNLQAHALGQQITASVLTGPNMNYAPVLTLSLYKQVLDGAIATTSAFETQYNRFSDKGTAIADQKIAWKAMLDQTVDSIALQQTLVNNALARWNSATAILNSAEATLRAHQILLQKRQWQFHAGIEVWKIKQTINTIVEVLQVVVGFAMAIGELAIGDPAGAAAAPAAAASAVKVATKAANVENSFLKPQTIKAIKSSTEAVFKLYQSTSTSVNDIRIKIDRGTDNTSKVVLNTAGGDVSGDNQPNADLAEILSLAAWDDWMLESDAQMAYAVAQSIGGAGAYQLELRRHAIDGKLLVQARAQAVKLGQEYIQLRLQLHATQANKLRLQQLYDTYQGEEEAALEAQGYFYDQVSMLRNSIMVYMRDAVWAYKYYTLSDSSIALDPLKTTLQYQQDSQMILQEVTSCKENYSSDFTPFSLGIQTLELPLSYPNSVVTALQSDSHSVTITFSPSVTSTSTSTSITPAISSSILPPITGPFTSGSRFRVFGMRAFLLGAKPLPSSFSSVTSKAPILLTISTSGIYNDVKDNVVYGYTMKPLERTFKYMVAKDGTVQLPYTFDSIIHSADYVDPTAFAQWTVKIENANSLDLSGLTGLELYWEGNARLNHGGGNA
ncbi:hypothetical protein SS1G_10715 [Sclerotinia sclerotiorum 1980 UF-70]|uniref:Uncharacterized protein n=2 Tax=Sclerotinia sclerotiorum (strain ATCC 18683 / 1980 / Ss-1) TaxID=665079 RepID=A0A1D9QCD4_SCLS1|nr:hypothetical protein SS1G_10715 [Sclerotinia sclerotiorum 1980 UF-70]APA12273.1 hypothetical protein sscle_09g070430 [Sclerotinia sclerotiorum 1980 UF-70]EDN94840.1 hypothetical protein SS1G_10715 [Sclerotinia sclerotiorum 1980 UF-70]